jgi:polar amino acid transport system substrate-binding protein
MTKARLRIGRSYGLLLICVSLLSHAMAEPVRIAHDQKFPPFSMSNGGNSEGLTLDILRAVAARAGIDMVFVPVSFDQRQATLENGRAEAYFPLSITPERLQTFDFSEVIVVTGGSVFVRAPNVPPDALDGLAGKIVVTPQTGPIAAFVKRTAPNVKLVVTVDYEDSLGRLARGEADAAVLSYHVGQRFVDRLYPGQISRSSKMFLELPLAVAVAKGKNEPLLTKLNQGIAAIRADGTWKQINDRWVGR